jgi:hypothetical protein
MNVQGRRNPYDVYVANFHSSSASSYDGRLWSKDSFVADVIPDVATPVIPRPALALPRGMGKYFRRYSAAKFEIVEFCKPVIRDSEYRLIWSTFIEGWRGSNTNLRAQ